MVVSCRALPQVSTSSSVRCFCDQRSALKVPDVDCSVTVSAAQPCQPLQVLPDGGLRLERGCRCAHPLARPQVLPVFLYQRTHLVRCVWPSELKLPSDAVRQLPFVFVTVFTVISVM